MLMCSIKVLHLQRYIKMTSRGGSAGRLSIHEIDMPKLLSTTNLCVVPSAFNYFIFQTYKTLAYVALQTNVIFLANYKHECWFFWNTVQLWFAAKRR